MAKFIQEAEQLPLFDYGGVNLAKLRERRDVLSAAPKRAYLTVRGYASDWSLFTRWCASAGRLSLPASPDTVGLYVTWMLTERCCKSTTTSRHLAAINHYHRAAGHPVPASDEVVNIIDAVRRERKEAPSGKAAITVEDLIAAVRACDPTTDIGARDQAILVFGFASALRRSNLVRLRIQDVVFEKEGICVFVSHSKTDQLGRGHLIPVWPGRRRLTDPMQVLDRWIQRRGSWPGPLFARITPRGKIAHDGLHEDTLNEAIKRACAKAGISEKRYSAHSLRAGAVTAAASNGKTDTEITRLTLHRSLRSMRRYIRPARLFQGRNPLAGVL